jgi:hypothetical protein
MAIVKKPRYKPPNSPKNLYRDSKRLPFPGETKEILRTRTAPKTTYGPYEVSKPYNNFILKKSGDRAVTKAKKFNAAKAAEKLASPPTKRLNISMGKAPAAKFAEDVGLRGAAKLAGKVASRFAGPVSAAMTAYEVGDALKDTGPALKARRALSDAAAKVTGLEDKEKGYAKGGKIDGCATKGKTKGKYI